MRDKLTNGEPNSTSCTPFNRGKVFVTADGSSATFIADTDVFDSLDGETPSNTRSGYLLLRDGTRFRIDDQGRCAWMRDRNGNMVSFSYSFDNSVGTFRLTGINDSIGRQISFNQTLINSSIVERRIDFVGFGGAPRTISVQYTNLGNALRSGFHLRTRQDLFPQLNGADGLLEDPQVVSSITLPNNQQYKFYYNSYAELARVELPAGGAIEYDYAPGLTDGPESGYLYLGVAGGHHIYRRVVERRVYPDGSSGGSFAMRTTYSRPESSASNAGFVQTDQYDSTGAVLGSQFHYFYGSARTSFGKEPTRYSPWQEGREYQTEELAADRTTVLRRVTHTWSQPVAGSHWPLTQPETQADVKPNDPQITQTVTALFDVTPNLVSKQTFDYDQYNNRTDAWVYDFDAGAPGLLIRRTHTAYVTLNNGVDYAADTNIHIRNLPSKMQVFDAGEIKRAETFYEYDLYDNSQNHAPLIDRLGISGLDSGFTTGYTTRGNVTRTSSALLNNSGGVTGWVNSHAQYDIAGNVVKAIDANDNPTTLDFSDRFGSPGDDAQQNTPPAELNGQTAYAFATKVTNALGHTTYTKYDYYLGKTVASEDANGIVSSIAYNDALDRPTQGIQARYKVTTPPCEPPSVCVPAEKRQTTITYDDTNRVIAMNGDRDTYNDNFLTGKSYYDSLGRTWRSAAFEGSTWTMTDTQFDALGRVSQVSNPYRADDPDSASPPSGLWTTTDYDELGRVRAVTTPDTATVNTEYSGNRTLVIDQAGKQRISQTDALGRLTKIWEVRSPDAASGTVSVSFPNHPEITAGYQTDYLYDALNNLRKVTQGAQTRWFAYDSLSRLIRAKNPEQEVNANPNMSYTDPVTDHNGWSMAYSYDANGILVSKTDARNITTTYGYDALNRNTTVSYSDSTPGVTRTYDTAALGKGRLQKTETAGSMGSRVTINAYDVMGRPLSQSQQFFYLGSWGTSYAMQQTYDLAGAVKTMTYPSNRIVNYSYDNAGRLSSFTGNLGDGQLRTYSTITQYHPGGMIERETFGTQTPLHHKKRYNNRLQLGDLRLSTGSDALSYDRGKLLFLHGPNAVANTDPFANDPTNNGNLVKQLHYVPIAGGGEVIPQADSYTYDALNRISGVVEPNVFTQTYGYDRWGNRGITGVTGGVNNYNPTYDTGSNRIVGPSYDQAGNITSDVLTGGTMTYDAESRLQTASAGGGGTYTYDADGKRTRRTALGQETWLIYGVGGELLAEYAANAVPSAPQKEYGYRGGQLLIVAEIGSGGGTSFVKPASKSGDDIGAQAGPGLDGDADGLFVVDEPVADLEFNEDSGSTTADVSSDNDTGTHIDGVTGTTVGGYGNALSFNGIGGALPAEHPPAAAPGAPQKEYGYRGGRSIITAQGGGVVTVNPSANQTPDPGQGGLAVNGNINTGHGSTIAGASNGRVQSKSCKWTGFQSVSGQITAITLKFEWSADVDIFSFFRTEYSIDGGSNWVTVFQLQGTGASSGSESVMLSPSQNISLVQVRDKLTAAAPVGEAAGVAVSISNIRIEVETDTTPPGISNVAAVGINPTSATITWNTNENSDSQVQYGTTQSYGQSTPLNPGLVISHSQSLSGLNSDTLYHYRVKSKDAVGNLAMSGDFTFRTPDITAPVISNVAAVVINPTSATITWTTNENSDSQVEYGTTQAYGQSTTLNPALVTSHSQGLSGLNPGTQYHYRVKSKDAAGNLAMSGDSTFTAAPDTSPPTVASFSPAAGATNVNADANVTVTFSEAMDAATVNGSTGELRDPSNALVPATVSYNAASLTATLDPTASLSAGVTYTARVRGGGTDPRVKDMAGNSLAADVTWTFTTAQNGSGGIKWLVTDHLGSTRMVVDETGSLAGIRRHDFGPFGEELFAGIGIRSAALGYGADSVRQKFTGKEKDDETGLDYFINRYYSSVQGRFTSVDPGNAGAEMEYPQAWNGYSYAINNPLTYSDPDGLKVKVCDANGNCSEISDADAKKYLFNKKYQEQSGYRLDGKGGVFDTGGNQIGTYKRTSFDDLSDEANAFIFGRGGMIDQSRRAKPIVEFVGTAAALQVATPFIGLFNAAVVVADLADNGGKPSMNTAIALASALVPPLRSLHGPKVYESGLAKGSLEYWRKQSTEKIIESLKPGATEPLITKSDGTIMQGNTRVKVLQERGVDVNSLPRTPH
ncbi:MAG TPA: Ig-like domain-containing protein [Blastocatellia bacterium]